MALSANEIAILVKAKDEASATFKQVQTSSGGLGDKLKVLAIAAVGAVTAFASFKTLQSVVSTTQELGAEVNKLKREIGGSAEDASKLLFAFEHLGLSGDAASTSLGILAKKLKGVSDEETGVTTGGKSTAAILADLGVKAFTTTGELASMGQILPQVAEVFKNMPDGVEKTGLAMQLFGRSGKDMIPVLNKGAEGLHDLGVEAGKFGLVLSEQGLQDIKNYTAAQRDLGAGFEGIKVQIGLAVLPALTDLTALFASSLPTIRAWISEGLQKIGDFLTAHETDIRNFGQALLDLGEQGFKRLIELGPSVVGIMTDLATVFQDVAANLVPILASALTTVGGLLQDHPVLVYAIIAAWASFQIGSFIQDLVGLAAGLFGVATASGVATGSVIALRTALITTGIGALVVALAVAAYYVWQNWNTIWPQLSLILQTAINNWIGYINLGIDAINGLLTPIRALLNALGISAGEISHLGNVSIAAAGAAKTFSERLKENGIAFETSAQHAGRLAEITSNARLAILETDRAVGKFSTTVKNSIPPIIDFGGGLDPDLTGGAGAAAEAFRGLDQDLADLRSQMRATAEAGLAVLTGQMQAEEDTIASLTGALDQLQAEHDDLTKKVQDSTAALQDWESAALKGTKAFSDALFGLSQQSDKLQLSINQIKLGALSEGLDEGGYASKRLSAIIDALARTLHIRLAPGKHDIDDINKVLDAAAEAMDVLRLKSENVNLKENLQLDPLRRQLEAIFDPTQEYTFDQIVAGWNEAQNALSGYNNAMVLNEDAQARLQASIEAHQGLLDQLKQAYSDLEGKLGEIDPAIKAIWEARGGDVIKSIEDAFAAIDRGDKAAADSAMADAQKLFDDIKALVPGAETGIFAPIEKVLRDVQTSVDMDFGSAAKAIGSDVGDVETAVKGGFTTLLSQMRNQVVYLLGQAVNRLDLLFDIRDALQAIPVAQHGGAVLAPGLVHVEAGESIIPSGGRGMAGGGTVINLGGITFNGPIMGDRRQAEEFVRWIMPIIKRKYVS